jgi:hypothetical protein
MTGMDGFGTGSYGDCFGVIFSGPPADGFWSDSLSISDRYIEPIFNTIQANAQSVPVLVAEWTCDRGWKDAAAKVAISGVEAQTLINALVALSVRELSEHCKAETPERCMECASTIAKFLRDHLAIGRTLYVERE